MAVGDIFLVDFHFENPTGVGSMGMAYREVTANATSVDECRDIADALHAVVGTAIRACLSDDWYFSAIKVVKVHGDPRPQYERTGKEGTGETLGTRTGPGLPANNAVLFEKMQETFSLRSNGKMYMPGIPEPDSNGNLLIAAYQTGPLAALAALLLVNVDAQSDTGAWEPGLISAKIRDAALPAKDWAGAFAVLTDIQPQGIIAIQKRRQTRGRGVSSTT